MRRKRKKIILIVDDKESDRAPVKDLLELDGYDVIEAASAEEATKKFEEKRPNLAIVDIKLKEGTTMPDFSGIRWITTLPEDFPVIVLSSHTEPDVIREALARRNNVVTYINKLESSDTLRANVRGALLEPKFQPKMPMWLRLTLCLLFASVSAALCWYYSRDFILALVAAIIVGGIVEIIRLFF